MCIGLATIVEKQTSSSFVGERIYGAWWFALLWAALTVTACVYMLREQLYKRVGVMVLHLSFVVILLGALTTWLTARRGTVGLRVGKQTTEYVDAKGQSQRLPFTLLLKEFRIVNYPGTDVPLDYQSIITVGGPSADSSEIVVSMNNIGSADGYRLFQSGYDSDGNGVSLGVCFDPYGIAITYTGYLLLLVGIVATMLSRKTHMRALYRKVMQVKGVGCWVTNVGCQTFIAGCMIALGTTSCTNTQHPSPNTQLQTVDRHIAQRLGTVNVLYNGRICPLNTAATDFLTKLSGSVSWHGLTADEVMASWMIYYSPWEQQKIIRIKDRDIQKLLGIDGQWASYSDFTDQHNEYKLKGALDEMRQGRGTVSRKALMQADEKFNVVGMFYRGQMLRLFPYKLGGQVSWYSPGAQSLPREIPVREQFFIKQAMDFLTEAIVTGQTDRALEIIAKIKLFQREMAGDVLPGESLTQAELAYNRLSAPKWPVFLSLTLSLLLAVMVSGGWRVMSRRPVRLATMAFVWLLTLWLTVLLVLRWTVSGHVPLSNGFETMQFMAWTLLVLTLLLQRRLPVLTGFGPLVACFCLLVSVLASGSPQVTPLMPVLASPLLSMHVMTVMVAYALFALQVLLGVQTIVLLHKRRTAEATHAADFSRLLLYPAVFLLAIGIFLGAVWANVSWGSYWSWDPKESWALITFMVYSVPLHSSSLSRFQRPLFYSLYMVQAFLTILMTYFGVNYLLGGMHSYA